MVGGRGAADRLVRRERRWWWRFQLRQWFGLRVLGRRLRLRWFVRLRLRRLVRFQLRQFLQLQLRQFVELRQFVQFQLRQQFLIAGRTATGVGIRGNGAIGADTRR